MAAVLAGAESERGGEGGQARAAGRAGGSLRLDSRECCGRTRRRRGRRTDDGRADGRRAGDSSPLRLRVSPPFLLSLRRCEQSFFHDCDRTNERTNEMPLFPLPSLSFVVRRLASSFFNPHCAQTTTAATSFSCLLSLSLPSLAPPSSSLSILYRGRKCCRCGVGKQALSSLSAILCAFLPYIRERRLEGRERGGKKERSLLPHSLALLRNASLCLRVTSPPPSVPPSLLSRGPVGRSFGRSVGWAVGRSWGE